MMKMMTVADDRFKEEASAVGFVLARMETHPEEFYGEAKKWAFIYKEYFRDVMTENEKAALHTKLKEIRREELTQKVLETITEEPEVEYKWMADKDAGAFGAVPVKREGTTITYDTNNRPVWSSK
jgi:hypothetical protein